MKKITRKIAAALMAALCLLPMTSMAAPVNNDGELMIRVGLASGSKHNAIGQLACAHLQNAEGYGKGFRFGYYDEELNFVELARTNQKVTQAAVMKTQNLCYGYDSQQGRYTYSASVDSNIRVGCFHIQMPGDYTDFEEAAEAAAVYSGAFVAWIDGAYKVRVGAYFTKEEAQAVVSELGEGEVVGTTSAGVSVVETGTDDLLFQFDDRGANKLAILPDVTDCEDVQTWFRGFKYRGGFTYERISGGNLTVVNVLPLEDYIKGVAPYEMGREWPLEALKTQATCARTYALSNLGTHESMGFDVCNSDWCQVYNGAGSGRTDYGPTAVSDRAVEETAGQVIWYKDTLAETFYSSSHGGASESIANVWGSSLSKYPYLCGVIDPYEQESDSINGQSPWTVTYSSSNLAKRLQGYGYGVGSKVEHLELTYSELGNVIKLAVHWTNGQKNTFAPDQIRSYFGLRSIRFTVNDAAVDQTTPEEETPAVNSGTQLIVNETEKITFTENFSDEIYVITGSGKATLVSGTPYVITGKGSKTKLAIEREEEKQPATPATGSGGTVTVSGSSYVFKGRGWGHSLGMSQYGAHAMAGLGFTYDEIIEFYFPGTHVDDY